MFPIACYQATGQHYAHSALNDRFPAILNAQNPAIPSAHPQTTGFISVTSVHSVVKQAVLRASAPLR